MTCHSEAAFREKMTYHAASDGRSVKYALPEELSASGSTLLTPAASTAAAAASGRSKHLVLGIRSALTRKNGAGYESSKFTKGSELIAMGYTRLGLDLTVAIVDFASAPTRIA